MTIELNEESVDAHFQLLTDPAKHGLPFRHIKECFEKSETVTPNHILAKEFIDKEVPALVKVFFYIVMEKIFGPPQGKAANGDLGYYLKYKPIQQ